MSEQGDEQLAAVQKLAEAVFENNDAAGEWLATPNEALGGSAPLALCTSAKGVRQVRSVLRAIEYGGVV